MMPFKFAPVAPFEDLLLVEPQRMGAAESWVMELFRATDFAAAGLPTSFPQDNLVQSREGLLRGFHYKRAGHEEGKLIRCARGRVQDVVVDIRPSSPTFGRHASVILDDSAAHSVYVPPGYAHAYLTLSHISEVVIKRTREFAPGHEGGIAWNDPALGVHWEYAHPSLSPKDAAFPGWATVRQELTASGAGRSSP